MMYDLDATVLPPLRADAKYVESADECVSRTGCNKECHVWKTA